MFVMLAFEIIFNLESLLETSDTLSPLTLEMVQSALIGLKQKKSIAGQPKKSISSQQKKSMADQRKASMQSSVRNFHSAIQPDVQSRRIVQSDSINFSQDKEYFPDLDLISVKGTAPLLLPHPGVFKFQILSTDYI